VKTGKLTVGPGVKQSLVGTTKRADGRMQVTYKKHPLYTFALDKRAGQTTGQASSNFGAKWYAVSARGSAVLKAPTTTTTDTTTTTTTTPYPPYP
jgi:ribosomal protein L31